MKKHSIEFAVLAFLFVSSPLAWGADGASLYKSKCTACHGANGEGKKGPALKGTSMSAEAIATLLSKGDAQKKAPHSKHMAGMTETHAKAVADYVKALK